MTSGTSSSQPAPHPRWERTAESEDFFIDEDRLVLGFYAIGGLSAALLGLLGVGLYRLCAAAALPPSVVGVCAGWVFTGPAQPLSALRDEDFDRQLVDTVEILFGRTEKGLVPAVRDFCAPEVLAAVDRAYADAAARYPAGYVQTLTVLEAKPVASAPGLRRVDFRALLSSRSADAAQVSPIYLECTFALAGATALNASGWRLVRLDALARDDFYRDERERSERQALELSP